MSLLFERPNEGAKAHKQNFIKRSMGFWVDNLRQATASLGEIWRTPFSSLMTILVLGMSLSLPAVLYVLSKNATQITDKWQHATQITLFVSLNQTEPQVAALQQQIGLRPDVADIDWIKADDALASFGDNSGFADAIGLLDSNPLPHVLIVTPGMNARRIAQARTLLRELEQQPGIDSGRLDVEWLKRLHAMIDLINQVVGAVGVLLILAVLMIVGNTVRLNILQRKDEIEVMKLVGATDGFIQRPFLYTGMWYGIIGALFSWIIIGSFLWWIEAGVRHVAFTFQTDFYLHGLTLSESLWLLLIAAAIGLFGAILSVRRHIRAIEPV